MPRSLHEAYFHAKAQSSPGKYLFLRLEFIPRFLRDAFA